MRRVEVQVPSVGIRVDLRLPVAAVATSTAEITAIPIEESSAEEGEGIKKERVDITEVTYSLSIFLLY